MNCRLNNLVDVRSCANDSLMRNQFFGDRCIGESFNSITFSFSYFSFYTYVCIQIGMYSTASSIATLSSLVDEFSIA